MILDGISRYGANFKGISVISELAIFCNAQSLSNWDISRRRDLGRTVFMYWEPRGTKYQSYCVDVCSNKNGVIKDSSSTDISATERLSITKYWWFSDQTNAFKMSSPITRNSIQDHRRSRRLNICLLTKSLLHCPMNFWPYCIKKNVLPHCTAVKIVLKICAGLDRDLVLLTWLLSNLKLCQVWKTLGFCA